MPEPWERGPNEPPRAYSLFEEYLALGPGRSLRQLADTGTASVAYLKELSSRWRWRERAAAYRAQVARSAFPTSLEEGKQARERVRRDARLLRRLAWAQMQQRVAEGKGPTPRELPRLLRRGVSLELLLRPMAEPQADPPHPSARSAGYGREPEASREHGTWEEEIAEALRAAQEAGVPGHLLPEAERIIGELLTEVVEFLTRFWEHACPEEESPGG